MERYYTKLAQNLAFGEIRFPAAGRKSSVHPEYQPSIILHEILHFSKKMCQISPKEAFPISFVPTPFFAFSLRNGSVYRPKFRDKLTRSDLLFSGKSFSAQDSKCGRRLNNAREFESLHLRQTPGDKSPERSGYPRITITVPSIVIMVPGLYFYRAVYDLGTMNLGDSASWLAASLLIVIALPLGLICARILTDGSFRRCT